MIPGADNDNYTPITSGLGTGSYYYWAIISFDGNDCDTAVSDSAQIVIISDLTVSISPLSQTLCQSATIDDICVVASGGTGTYQYQWWENINNGVWSIATTGTGANTDCYTPQNTTVNTTEYYCVVTQLGGQGCEVTSNTATVVIVTGPSFTIQPQDSSVCVDGYLTINVDYTDGTGTPIYQWYENSICDSIGAVVSTGPGNNTDTYTPQTATQGPTFYYCTINLPMGGCDIITSQCAEIIVYPDPTVDTQPLDHDTICLGGTISPPLQVSYTAGTGVGNDTYQWYSNNTNNNIGGTPVSGATNNNFTPSTSSLPIGDYYYYAIISFSGNHCDDATSNVAHIHIIGDPTPDFDLLYDSLCVNHNLNPVWINQSSGNLKIGIMK